MKIVPVRFVFVLPIIGYTLYVIARPGLLWSPGAAIATLLAVGAGLLPVLAPRRWTFSWAPFAAILIGSAAATVTTLLPSGELPGSLGALFLALGVAGLVSVPVVVPLWASLARRAPAAQLLLIVLGAFSTVLLAQAIQTAQGSGIPAAVGSLPEAVDNVDGAQAASFVANLLGHGPSAEPPLSSALDPVFVLATLLALAGVLLSWIVPQTDRGVSLLEEEELVRSRARVADPLRFVAPEERARLALASSPARPPLGSFPGVGPVAVAAVASIVFVTSAAIFTREALPYLLVAVLAGLAAVYALGRSPIGAIIRRRTSARR
ncbi:MAG: hypothetical protein L3K23_03640 [Thermoplasmata archaeon]|nr:hypothetical protein [Thermoplasmata archaeon]